MARTWMEMLEQSVNQTRPCHCSLNQDHINNPLARVSKRETSHWPESQRVRPVAGPHRGRGAWTINQSNQPGQGLKEGDQSLGLIWVEVLEQSINQINLARVSKRETSRWATYGWRCFNNQSIKPTWPESQKERLAAGPHRCGGANNKSIKPTWPGSQRGRPVAGPHRGGDAWRGRTCWPGPQGSWCGGSGPASSACCTGWSWRREILSVNYKLK